MTFEVCIDSFISAKAAEQGGAHRVEICDNLLEGGTTPSFGMVKSICENTTLEVMVMIRPRGGDFLYNKEEVEIMALDIEHFKKLPIKGFVFGLLNDDGSIDVTNTQKLIALARPFEVTFHRAFDRAKDPFQALENLIDLGVKSVLTSGQQPNAFAGKELIAQLNEKAGGKMTIMPGGGINEDNIQELITTTGVSEFHASAKIRISSKMKFQNTAISMSSETSSEFDRYVASEERVRELLKRATLGEKKFSS